MAEPSSIPVLATHGVSRRFGGLTAVDNVDLELAPNAIHAIIGPNGAGKSTLINVLSGELRASAGTIELRGVSITGWPADKIARGGVARTFQRTNVFGPFSVFENCRLAAQSSHASIAHWLRPAARYAAWNEAASRAVVVSGLESRADVEAASLSHGERRVLEIAMALATAPSVLLLDEPLAGMGAEESGRMVALLKGLADNHAILLIEHDMDAVFALADRLTVMTNGRILASGLPQDVRANEDVQRAYLGTMDSATI